MHSSDITIQPMPCAQPNTRSALREPGHEPDGQQRQVDRRVGEREVLELLEGHRRPRAAPPSAAAAASASAGHAAGSAGHQAWRVVLVVARHLGAGRAARPGRRAWPSGWAGRRAPPRRGAPGTTDHSSSSSRASATTGSSPTSTAPPAPSAQRPAQVATHAARRPASQRPSALRTAHRTDSAPSASSRDEPQRPAHRLQLDRRARRPPVSKPASRAARPSCVGDPRSCKREQRRVGGGGQVGPRLVAVLAPARRDLVGPPGPAGEDSRLEIHGLSVVRRRVRFSAMSVDASAKNMQAVCKAKEQHDKTLPVGRHRHRGAHELVRHRADGLGGGRRDLRARRRRRRARSPPA